MIGPLRDAAVVTARTLYRLPLPPGAYVHALREARRALPPTSVQVRHKVGVEMLGRTRAVWLDQHLADQGVIVHLPGGAYASGPFMGDWEWLSRHADALGCAAVLLDYRKAPDHQHPIGLDDTAAALRALAESGVLSDAPWVLTGQNSGGGLALTTARRIAAAGSSGAADDALHGVPAPALIVTMSPWLDLSLSNSMVAETSHRDPVHEMRMLHGAALAYAGRTDLSDPELSPIHADLRGIAPVHLSVGTSDVFCTDARIARLHMEESGVDVRYREISGRLGTLVRLRRGEDMERLLREQREAIATALGR